MHVLILGAASMIGRKLTRRLIADSVVAGRQIARLILLDIVAPEVPGDTLCEVACVTADFSAPDVAGQLVTARPELIFHLAGVVSGEAEENFEKGYRVNLDGARQLFETIRIAGLEAPYRPRLVFTSSLATFGAPFPEVIGDEFCQTPLTSYGTQKAIVELLLADYSRRGFFDGIGLRLPTICIRPGKPNKAASGFFSSILREPLAGRGAVLPVPESVLHWFASPRAAVGFLLHAASLDLERVGPRRNLNMPGISATVGEEIEALRRVAGAAAVKLIRRAPDPTIERIVAGWPRAFDTRQARELGFRAESSFDEIIRAYVEDELDGRIGG